MVTFVISQSILIPIIVGLFRLRIIWPGYWPFFIDLIAGIATEIISFIMIQHHSSNAVPTNIFVLVEWLLVVYQFHLWGFLKKRKNIFLLLWSIPVLIWIIENLVFKRITTFSPYFRILYAFLITLMSITEINFKIINDDRNLFRNPRFIICIGFILFYVYQILYEWAYQLSVFQEPTGFTNTIISLFAYMNALTNIIFGIAFLFVPAQKEYKME
ncbi:MAG: hypothetical protein C5B59_14850 [Bacteroidetes bacterium]|nr:MAG: hypothetical protein C5B59_14850 [Bacteroidota bacterium]